MVSLKRTQETLAGLILLQASALNLSGSEVTCLESLSPVPRAAGYPSQEYVTLDT